MNLRVALLSAVFLSIASGRAIGASGGADSKRVAAGTWGAMGIAMEVTESGARIEYDCAHGTIGEPLLLDAEGRFDVKGNHVPEHGGPVREGEESRGRPVRYSGQVAGDRMTLTVKAAGSDGSVLGSYELVRGKMGRIHKCL